MVKIETNFTAAEVTATSRNDSNPGKSYFDGVQPILIPDVHLQWILSYKIILSCYLSLKIYYLTPIGVGKCFISFLQEPDSMYILCENSANLLDAEFAVILDGQIVATTVEFIQALFLDGLHIQCEVSRNCQKDIYLT